MEGPVIIALDIEARGPSAVRHGIVSIGYCIAKADGDNAILRKGRFDIAPYSWQQNDPECMVTFWNKQGDLMETLQRHAQTPSVAMPQFRRLLDEYAAAYIVCDAPGFDFYMINAYLDREGLPLLQFDRDGKFRALHDADSYARGRLRYGFERSWVSNNEACSALGVTPPALPNSHRAHMPEDDAQAILLTHVAIVRGRK